MPVVTSDDQTEDYVMLEKKPLSASKSAFDLHVALIMRTHQVSKPAAIAQAYYEGVAGLNRRLPLKGD